MSLFERVIFTMIACALWVLVLGDLVIAPAARAQTANVPDRTMSQILHEVVAGAIAGEEPGRLDGDDELEVRLRAILSRVVPAAPQTERRISKQEIRSALASCRVVGTVNGHTGRLDARLSC